MYPTPRIVLDGWGCEASVDLVSQRVDVHLDDVAAAVEMNVPHMLDDEGPRHRACVAAEIPAGLRRPTCVAGR